MGRRPSNPGAIPRFRVRKKPSGVVHYYYDTGGRPRVEIPLGRDYGLAIKKWAELEGERDSPRIAEVITFRWVADEYRRVVVPTKAAKTQKVNLYELRKLIEYFDDPPAPLEAIEPINVRQYMTWRKKLVSANREKALLSHIWNWAREKGYTALPNPCAGIKGASERGRKDVYIEDDQYTAVWNAAAQPLRDAMDLAYLTGQRPADVLGMTERDIRDGSLAVKQRKTRAKVRIAIVGELAALLARIEERKRAYDVHALALVVDQHGQPMTTSRLRKQFDAARAAAGVDLRAFQFRDLRAKAATDKADSSGDIRQAQRQMGHTTIGMTEDYVRERRGAKVTPTK